MDGRGGLCDASNIFRIKHKQTGRLEWLQYFMHKTHALHAQYWLYTLCQRNDIYIVKNQYHIFEEYTSDLEKQLRINKPKYKLIK